MEESASNTNSKTTTVKSHSNKYRYSTCSLSIGSSATTGLAGGCTRSMDYTTVSCLQYKDLANTAPPSFGRAGRGYLKIYSEGRFLPLWLVGFHDQRRDGCTAKHHSLYSHHSALETQNRTLLSTARRGDDLHASQKQTGRNRTTMGLPSPLAAAAAAASSLASLAGRVSILSYRGGDRTEYHLVDTIW
jgi:hypothetical protein